MAATTIIMSSTIIKTTNNISRMTTTIDSDNAAMSARLDALESVLKLGVLRENVLLDRLQDLQNELAEIRDTFTEINGSVLFMENDVRAFYAMYCSGGTADDQTQGLAELSNLATFLQAELDQCEETVAGLAASPS